MTPTTRVLIAAARAGLQPDAGAAARVRAKLDLALAAPPPPAPAAPAIAAPASGLSLKLLVALAVIGGVAIVAVPSGSTPATSVPAPTTFDDVILTEAPPTRIVAATSEPAAPALTHRAHAATVTTPAPRSHAGNEVSLAREVELIDRAMGALRAGHASDALAAIAIYHHETADRGQLTEDASAIDIEASCKLHLDVGDKLAAFERAWPSSAQRSRLTTACH